MRALVLLLLVSCGAPPPPPPDMPERCDGSIPVACDGRCVWRCLDGRWRTESPCQPCVCVGDLCSRAGP